MDVSVAAYYMKNLKISFREYDERIMDNRKEFNDFVESFSDEKGYQFKTRYKITVLTFQELLRIEPSFRILFILIGLLGSQNIMRDTRVM